MRFWPRTLKLRYFPEAHRTDEHGKLLLTAPGYDGSGGIGFRCVREAR